MGKPMEVGDAEFALTISRWELTYQQWVEYLEYFSQTSPQFPQVSGPSSEDVDSAHKQYMAALASLYLKHNDDEQVSLVIT